MNGGWGDPLIGDRIARYQVTRLIGTGTMGTVYRATHAGIGHEVAIKILRQEVSQRPALLQRFLREAKLVASLKRPGVPQIHDLGTTDDGRAYLVMELLVGESLQDRLLRQRKLEVHKTLMLGRYVARTLAAVHARGIVHRDLKPDNIFIVKDASVEGGERTKILDFGVAQVTALQADDEEATLATELLGTPLYMAPEQCRGASEVDARADVYALGCVLFRMLCSVPPIVGDTTAKIIAGHLSQEPQPPSCFEANIPREVDALLLRCLAKKRHERLGSMQAFVEAVDRILSRTHRLGKVVDIEHYAQTVDIRDKVAPKSFADAIIDYTIPIDGAVIEASVAEAKQRRRDGAGAATSAKESWAFTQPLKPEIGKHATAQRPAAREVSLIGKPPAYTHGRSIAVAAHGASAAAEHATGAGMPTAVVPTAAGSPTAVGSVAVATAAPVGGRYRSSVPSWPGHGARAPMHAAAGQGYQAPAPHSRQRAPVNALSLNGMRPPMPSLQDNAGRPSMPLMGVLKNMRAEPLLKPHHYVAIAGFVLAAVAMSLLLFG